MRCKLPVGADEFQSPPLPAPELSIVQDYDQEVSCIEYTYKEERSHCSHV